MSTQTEQPSGPRHDPYLEMRRRLLAPERIRALSKQRPFDVIGKAIDARVFDDVPGRRPIEPAHGGQQIGASARHQLIGPVDRALGLLQPMRHRREGPRRAANDEKADRGLDLENCAELTGRHPQPMQDVVGIGVKNALGSHLQCRPNGVAASASDEFLAGRMANDTGAEALDEHALHVRMRCLRQAHGDAGKDTRQRGGCRLEVFGEQRLGIVEGCGERGRHQSSQLWPAG